MKNSNHNLTTRRQFITKVVPACAMTCIGGKHLLGVTPLATQEQSKHKFDLPMERTLTNRQFTWARNSSKIQLIKTMIKELGKDRAIEIIKTDTRESALAMGQRQAKAAKKNDFYTYVDMFRDPERFKNSLTMEIIEDSEKAFELKVTECLFAEPYIKAGLGGEVGFAALCYMDYFWPKGFNEKIKLVRDKTLMQGHACCNHRYIWEG
jgi:hypothetical protein